MKDAMLDLETFGNGYNAAVVSIGACYFDRKTGEVGSEFHVGINAEDSERHGFEIDASTVYWWLARSKEAQKGLLTLPRNTVEFSISSLNAFLRHADFVWSHATFDFVILTNHLRKLEIKPSFPFWAARDLRTITDLAGINPKSYAREGTHHDALDDCKHQIKYTVDCFKILGDKK